MGATETSPGMASDFGGLCDGCASGETRHDSGKRLGVMAKESDVNLAGVPVLIVEDEEVTARFIAATLETCGCDTKIAHSAEEAMALLAPFAPRAIVLDLVLPQLSGLMLAEQLKQNPATRDIPIIATSRFSAQDAAQIALDAGCVDYIRTPIDPESFARVLRDHIDLDNRED